jgi:glycosyltransferase involved in cell wall biosynthesis
VVLQPALTIITPVFNGENFIAETISSILDALVAVPYEYIVLNDGSTDSTASILSKFADRIKILTHSNIGESATVNRGLHIAQGEFVLVISADDPLLTGELVNRACKILSNDPDLVAIYPDWRIIDELGQVIMTKVLPEFSEEIMIGRCKCLPGPGTVFRKSAAIKIGGRRDKWKYVGDYDFWLRMSRVGKIVRLPGVLAQWRQNQKSTSISQRGLEMATERINVIDEFLAENELTERLNRKALGNSYYLAARLAFFDTRINGKTLLIKAFKSRRGWPEEARIQVVLYIFLMPISSIMLKPIKSLIVRINSYK